MYSLTGFIYYHVVKSDVIFFFFLINRNVNVSFWEKWMKDVLWSEYKSIGVGWEYMEVQGAREFAPLHPGVDIWILESFM